MTSPAIIPKSAPKADNRLRILEATMKKQQYQPDVLIEVLHKAQLLFGYLSDELLLTISHQLKLPPSRVYGVATFYHFFARAPQGEHVCTVCLGTACYVKGSAALVSAIEQEAGIKVGETTPDNKLSLTTARCIGACGIAPTAVFDGTVAGQQSVEGVLERVKGWLHNGSD